MPRFRIATAGLFCVGLACNGSEDPSDTGGDETAPVTTTTPGGTQEPPPNDDDAGATGDPTGSPTTGDETDSGVPPDDGGSSESTGGDEVPEIPPECEASVLADVVADMAPGSWAEMPENESLLGLEMGYSLLYWADSGVFDAQTRTLHWVGGPGTCCASPATYQRISYDELSDTWSIEATPYEGSGHAYDGNAFEPGTTNHYFAKFSDAVVRVHDGGGWGDLPALPFDGATTMGLTWFPEMDGMIYVGGFQDLAHWDGSAWSALTGPSQAWGSYNVFAEHSPAHGVVWMGGGNGANEVNFTLESSGSLTRQPDAPVSLGNGQGVHFADPAGGNFIVFHTDSGAWWELDPVAQAWSQIDMSAPNFQGSLFQVPLPHCGVTLFFDHYWENRHVHLYRHG